MNIEVREKEASLNWATHYSRTELKSSINDDQKNFYMAGYFYDFSNFKDNTTLNAIYSRVQMTDMLLSITKTGNYNG